MKELLDACTKSDAAKSILEDGDLVKLNAEQIMKRGEWGRLNENYRSFIQENRDTVFKVCIRRRDKGGYPVIVDLEGVDGWSFWTGDLVRLEEVTEQGGEQHKSR